MASGPGGDLGKEQKLREWLKHWSLTDEETRSGLVGLNSSGPSSGSGSGGGSEQFIEPLLRELTRGQGPLKHVMESFFLERVRRDDWIADMRSNLALQQSKYYNQGQSKEKSKKSKRSPGSKSNEQSLKELKAELAAFQKEEQKLVRSVDEKKEILKQLDAEPVTNVDLLGPTLFLDKVKTAFVQVSDFSETLESLEKGLIKKAGEKNNEVGTEQKLIEHLGSSQSTLVRAFEEITARASLLNNPHQLSFAGFDPLLKDVSKHLNAVLKSFQFEEIIHWFNGDRIHGNRLVNSKIEELKNGQFMGNKYMSRLLDEKVVLWSRKHVQLGFKNKEMTKFLQTAKLEFASKLDQAGVDKEVLDELLLTEELKKKYQFYQAIDSNPQFSFLPPKNQGPVASSNRDMSLSCIIPPTKLSTNVLEDLTVSLIKTWPTGKSMFQDFQSESRGALNELSEKLMLVSDTVKDMSLD